MKKREIVNLQISVILLMILIITGVWWTEHKILLSDNDSRRISRWSSLVISCLSVISCEFILNIINKKWRFLCVKVIRFQGQDLSTRILGRSILFLSFHTAYLPFIVVSAFFSSRLAVEWNLMGKLRTVSNIRKWNERNGRRKVSLSLLRWINVGH